MKPLKIAHSVWVVWPHADLIVLFIQHGWLYDPAALGLYKHTGAKSPPRFIKIHQCSDLRVFPFEFLSVLFFAAYKMQLGFDPSTESIWRWGWKCWCGQLLWNSVWYLLQQHRTSGPAWHWLIIYRGSWPWMLTVSIPLSKVQLVFTVQKTPWPNYCSCRASTRQTLQ